MPEPIDVTAWSSLLLGLFALSAGVGALRKPESWQTMIAEIARSPALQMLTGMLELIAGAIVYLANPWLPADILACVMKTLGGLMIVEALVVLAMSDIYLAFWLKAFTHLSRSWAAISAAIGLALAVAGALRFH